MKIFCLSFLLFLYACGENQVDRPTEKEAENKIIARLGDKKLMLHDLVGIFPANSSQSDSTDLIRRFAENWVKKELMLREARNKARLDEAEIERKVADYRYSLTVYEFEKQYLQKELDTLVSESLMKQYYQDNITNFVLKQAIVKAVYAKVDKKHTHLGRIRSLIRSTEKKESSQLTSLCAQAAEQYHLSYSTWTHVDQLIYRTPWNAVLNKAPLLQANKLTETSDEQYVYLLHIREVRTAGDTAPLEFAKDQIRSLLLNQRKVSMIHSLGKQVFERARANKEFEIY